MKVVFYILLIFIFLSCCRGNCNEDVLYKKQFNQSLAILQRSSLETQLVEDIRKAVIFLNATTGIEAEQFDIEHGVFYNNDAFTNSINKWENWYSNNKCSMTISKADSLVNIYK